MAKTTDRKRLVEEEWNSILSKQPSPLSRTHFPPQFIFGSATSAYQVSLSLSLSLPSIFFSSAFSFPVLSNSHLTFFTSLIYTFLFVQLCVCVVVIKFWYLLLPLFFLVIFPNHDLLLASFLFANMEYIFCRFHSLADDLPCNMDPDFPFNISDFRFFLSTKSGVPFHFKSFKLYK